MTTYRRIGLYGIRGVGKSSIIEEIVKLIPSLHHMDGTFYVIKAAGMSLDKFKTLTETEKKRIREKAIEIAFEDQLRIGKDFLTAGHMAFPNEKGSIIDVMTEKDLEFYTEFIYMKLPPEVVYCRQREDTAKNRKYTLPVIISWIDYEVKKLGEVCNVNKIPLRFITETNFQESVKTLIAMVQK